MHATSRAAKLYVLPRFLAGPSNQIWVRSNTRTCSFDRIRPQHLKCCSNVVIAVSALSLSRSLQDLKQGRQFPPLILRQKYWSMMYLWCATALT